MYKDIAKFIVESNLIKDVDGIYSSQNPVNIGRQEVELSLRSKVAGECGDEFLELISKSHSIGVMDYEVDRFINDLGVDSLILDVGGCWGWHWRDIVKKRPDITVVVVDLVKENLYLARKILGNDIDTNFILVHANACTLPFPNEIFDGIWSVQVTQHIELWQDAYNEIKRVMKCGSKFIDYNLRINPFIKLIYKLLGKKYFEEGHIENFYYLRKFKSGFEHQISDIFNSKVVLDYSECLFHPDLKITVTGKYGNFLGLFDIWVSKLKILSWLIARQASISVKKNYNE